MSIGVAEALPPEDPVDQVLPRADAALYEAKHRGRNRVVQNGTDVPPRTHADAG